MNINTNWSKVIGEYDEIQEHKFDDFYKETLKLNNSLNIYPTSDNIFRCFKYFDIENTKVVILGQDPYHGPNQATGLCFEAGTEGKYPPSLRNIEKELGKKVDFESWCKQGVLLLNSSLTVVQGKPGSHMKYWMPFTKYIINIINNKCPKVEFIVWGAFALKLVENIDTEKHLLHISSHPSPLSFKKKLKNFPSFSNSKVFSKINNINW